MRTRIVSGINVVSVKNVTKESRITFAKGVGVYLEIFQVESCKALFLSVCVDRFDRGAPQGVGFEIECLESIPEETFLIERLAIPMNDFLTSPISVAKDLILQAMENFLASTVKVDFECDGGKLKVWVEIDKENITTGEMPLSDIDSELVKIRDSG